MKENLLTGWTFRRAIFLLVGIVIIVQSGSKSDWLGVALGSYFSAMGLFQIGCASGACFVPPISPKDDSTSSSEMEDLEFEEVKLKN